MTGSWSESEERYFRDILLETSTILTIWYQWETLFNPDAERLSQMSVVGNLLFGSIERVFYRDVILGICRLTDPEDQKGNKNITIMHFREGIYHNDAKLKSLIDSVQALARPFQNWRNKRLAHLDAATGVGWHPPQGCERGAITEALQALAAVLRHVSAQFCGTELLLGERPNSTGNGHVQKCPLREQIRPLIQRTISALSNTDTLANTAI